MANVLTNLTLKKETCYLFTDGSYLSTIKKGAAAWVAVHDKDITYESITFENTTNNQMELTAALNALHWALENGFKNVVLISDSEYTLACIGYYPIKWVATKWMIKQGQPVKNQELIKPLLKLAKKFDRLELHWTKAHAGCFYNEKADYMAENLQNHRATTIKDYDGPRNVPTTYKYLFQSEHFDGAYWQQVKKEQKLKRLAQKKSQLPFTVNQTQLFA